MNRTPIDYGFCAETVTLYHRPAGPFACERKVFRGAFFDRSRNRQMQPDGPAYEDCFLLILPSGWQHRPAWAEPEVYAALDEEERAERFTLSPGDKLVAGEGPQVTTAADWAGLESRHGAALVKETAVRTWQGRVCHIEAGGLQMLGRSGLPHRRHN